MWAKGGNPLSLMIGAVKLQMGSNKRDSHVHTGFLPKNSGGRASPSWVCFFPRRCALKTATNDGKKELRSAAGDPGVPNFRAAEVITREEFYRMMGQAWLESRTGR